MIRSMTGFGKASIDFDGKKISAEIKTLNSKMNDTKLRIPSTYREKELSVRNKIADALVRGKIDAFISIENSNSEATSSINENLATEYHSQLKSLGEKLGENGNYMSLLLRMPGVMETAQYEPNDDEWKNIWTVLEQALNGVNQFREDEGAQMETDLIKRISNIENHLNGVLKLAPQRTLEKKEKLNAKFKEQLEEFEGLDKNRFEQELIYYLEKLDITEEEVRLKSHLEYFRSTMKNGSAQGKKLGFISQEMGREINTIGSKANHAEMQKHVVQMKDELEKIKEQVLNIL
ncbi:MAG: YicC/YloC family endoribonuclease [Salibacteraceae bacterium]